MLIRQAIPSDSGKITELGLSLFKMHSDNDITYYNLDDNTDSLFHNWVIEQLKNPSAFIFVAEESIEGANPIIVSFISGFIKSLFPWFKIKSVGHISFMVVDFLYQQKNIGKMLEKEACNWFKSRNISYIELYVDEFNTTGKTVWNKLGFSPFKQFLRKKII